MRGRRFTTIIADDLYAGHTHRRSIEALFRSVYSGPVLLAYDEQSPFKPTKGEKMKNKKLTALEKRQDKAICELYSRLSSAKVVTESIQLRRQAEAEDNAITALVTTAKSFGCRVIVSIGYRGELVYTAEKSARA